MSKKERFATRTVHAGESHCRSTGALRTPIYQSSTFVFDNVDQGARRFSGEEDGYIYTRLGNPTQTDLEKKMAALENGESAIAVGSGMAAISGTILGLLDAGDHLIASESIYGSSHSLFEEILPRWNIEVSFIDMTDMNNLRDEIRDNTKVIYAETPSNPTMSMVDLKELADIAQKNSLTSVVDNTFMSPYLQKPLNFGIDIVVHSATKYISGHGDTIAGIIIGPEELVEKFRMTTIKDIGAIIAPFDAFLLLRGLKTLAVRMDRSCENAKEIARFLKSHPAVEKVNYPGLPEHPQYKLGESQMKDFGGLMSFELKGGLEDGKKLMNTVELCTLAVSLGDVDTLIQHPASMTHSVIPKEERVKAGIKDSLVRLSVGIEAVEDIVDDLKQSLDKLI